MIGMINNGQFAPAYYVINEGSINLPRKSIMGISISQVVMGALIFILHLVAMFNLYRRSYFYEYYNKNDGLDFWTGALLVVTGGIGIAATKQSSSHSQWMMAYMILNILTVTLLARTFLTAYESGSIGLLIYMINVPLGGAQFIITIAAAALGCKSVCCQHKTPQNSQLYLPLNYNPLLNGQPNAQPTVQATHFSTQASVFPFNSTNLPRSVNSSITTAGYPSSIPNNRYEQQFYEQPM